MLMEKLMVSLERKLLEDDVLFSAAANNSFSWRNDFNGIPFAIDYVRFIKGAEEGLVETADGDYYLKIVEAGDGNRHDHYLKMGEVASIHNILFAFNAFTEGAINITYEADQYTINLLLQVLICAWQTRSRGN